jgi:hypothetical protein
VVELFEFEVLRDSGPSYTDRDWERLVSEILEPRQLFWGGGCGGDYFRGVISSEESADVDEVIKAIADFFSPNDRITIRLIAGPDRSSTHGMSVNQRNVSFEPYTG